jgi:hypothetical protein
VKYISHRLFFLKTFIVTQSEQLIHAQTLDHVRETSCSLLLSAPKLGQVVAIARVDSLGTIYNLGLLLRKMKNKSQI